MHVLPRARRRRGLHLGLSGGLLVAMLALGWPARGADPAFIPGKIDCSISSGGAKNALLTCPGDTNAIAEPSLAVDPANPRHVVVLNMEPLSCCLRVGTTFNAGATWQLGNLPVPAPPPGNVTSMADPMVVFDSRHKTVVAMGLALAVDLQTGATGDSDVVSAVSRDGGLTWSAPTVVAQGQGFGQRQLFNDKPWLSVDNHRRSPHYGRLYATWDFLTESGASFDKEAEYGVTHFASSDDGGSTWTAPRAIRPRSLRYCWSRVLGATRGVCDRNFFTTSTVTPDGTVHLAFGNPQNPRAREPREDLEDQYLAVRSRNGGRTWGKPTHIVSMEDGTRDYPMGKSEQQALTGMQLAVTAFGSLASDPKTGRLALVFSDNRAGRHDVAHPVTHTRVFAMRSVDGVRWRGPIRVSGGGRDAWMPFADFNPSSGRLGVVYQHRKSAKPSYGAVLATQRGQGFRRRRISTAASHPNRALWYLQQAGSPVGPGAPPCATCAQWAGDYVWMRYGGSGRANIVWNDMRTFLQVPSSPFGPAVPSGHNQAVAFARR
jgi:hypothetical protein